MWDPSIVPIIWGIPMKCLKLFYQNPKTQLDLEIAQKYVANELLSFYTNFLQFFRFYFQPPHILTMSLEFEAFVMTLQLYSQLKSPLSYIYSSSAHTYKTSHKRKKNWMNYEIHELFAWTFFLWKYLIIIIIIYLWILHFSQMTTHYDGSCSYSLSKF